MLFNHTTYRAWMSMTTICYCQPRTLQPWGWCTNVGEMRCRHPNGYWHQKHILLRQAYVIWFLHYDCRYNPCEVYALIFTREDIACAGISQCTMPHYKLRCKKKDLRQYYSNYEVIFWQMTSSWNEDINKDGTCLLNLLTKLLVSANTSVQF